MIKSVGNEYEACFISNAISNITLCLYIECVLCGRYLHYIPWAWPGSPSACAWRAPGCATRPASASASSPSAAWCSALSARSALQTKRLSNQLQVDLWAESELEVDLLQGPNKFKLGGAPLKIYAPGRISPPSGQKFEDVAGGREGRRI